MIQQKCITKNKLNKGIKSICNKDITHKNRLEYFGGINHWYNNSYENRNYIGCKECLKLILIKIEKELNDISKVNQKHMICNKLRYGIESLCGTCITKEDIPNHFGGINHWYYNLTTNHEYITCKKCLKLIKNQIEKELEILGEENEN